MVIAGCGVEPGAGVRSWPAWAAVDFGFAAEGFLTVRFLAAGFFFAAGLAGAGMVIPGMSLLTGTWRSGVALVDGATVFV